VNVTVNPSPLITAVADQRICLGNAVQLTANSNAGNYQWNPSPNSGLSCYTCPNPVASPLTTTTYIVSTVNSFGCSNRDTVKVTVIPPFTMNVQPLRDTICIGESVQLVANGASNYLWSPSATLSCNTCNNPIATPVTTTLYQVIGSDNYNCFKDTVRVELAVGRYPIITMPASQVLSTGTLYTIVPQITNGPIVDYEWTPELNLSCADCPHPVAIVREDICYQLKAENQYHCADTAEFCIRAFCENTQVFIPNTFTPTQATNNIFRVRGTGIKSIRSFRVYNRWGEIVYEASNIPPNGDGWDGKIRGVMATPDVFVYTAEVVCDNGVPFTYRGNVTLLR
jgi:gliding motility-associated-like protein